MVGFSSVVAAVEEMERTSLRSLTTPRLRLHEDATTDTETASEAADQSVVLGATISRALGAYEESILPSAKVHALPPQEGVKRIKQLLARLDREKLSRKEICSLRRRIAWLCHPDKRIDDAAARTLMAEANARIDAALALHNNRNRR